MIRLIYYAILAYLVYVAYRFIVNLGKPRPASGPAARTSETMVKDEACNTYIPRDGALRETIGGHDFYFCSRDCRKKFLERKRDRPAGRA